MLNTQSLVLAGKAESDGSDIRVLSSNGAQLDFWFNASDYNTTATDIWVRADTLPASDLSTLYLFYGNTGAALASNATNTFEFFDDFTGTALSGTKWNSCGNVSVGGGQLTLSSVVGGNDGLITTNSSFNYDIITEMYVNSVSGGIAGMGQIDSGSNGWEMTFEDVSTNEIMRLMESDLTTACDTLLNQSPSINQVSAGSTTGEWSFAWHTTSDTKFSWPGGIETRSDAAEAATYANPKFMRIAAMHNTTSTSGTLNVDWARIRKYASVDPVITILTEQELVDAITASNTGEYCEGETIELDATSFTGGVYNWVGPLGFTSSAEDPTIASASSLASGTYYVTASIPGGCGAETDSTVVTVHPTSVGGTVSGSASVCEDANSGTLYLNSYQGAVLYWETSASAGGPWTTITTTADSLTYTNLTATSYFRAILQSGVCTQDTSTTASVTVDQVTVGGTLTGDNTVCPNTNSGTLTLFGRTGSISHWEYSNDMGATWSTITNNTNTQAYSNLTTESWYRVEVTNGACATEYSDTAVIAMYAEPIADFSNTSVCQGLATNFTNLSSISSGSITDYLWDFDDGTGGVVSNPIHTYSGPGTYSVLLRITSNQGCIDSARYNVVVHPNPTINFSYSNVCDSTAMPFVNLSTISSGSITGYVWDFGDGTGTYTPTDTSYLYAQDSTYTVWLYGTSNQGCVDSTSENVVVYPVASVDFIGDSVCLGQAINFVNTTQTSSSSISYQWSFGDGGTSTNLNPTYTYGTAGTYIVTLQTTVPGGCTNSNSHIVEIYPAPIASFTYSDQCLYDSVIFANTSTISSGSLNYLWDFGDGSTSNLVNESHLYAVPGTFTVTLDITSDFGCMASTSEVVNIHPIPTANYSFSDECDETTVSFTNTSSISSGSLTHAWDFDDGTTSIATDVNHLFPADGTYNVQLIVTSDKGCSDTVEKAVTIFPLPQPDFTFNIACDGAPTSFINTSTISGGTIVSYAWDLGDATTSTDSDPTHQYLNAGTYSVQLTATSNLGCVNDTTIDVQVSTFPLADFSATDACLGDAAIFTNSSTISVGTLSYHWDFGDGDTSVVTDPSHTYTAVGTYSVQLIANSNLGCSDSVTRVVTVNDLPLVEAGMDTSISQGYSVQLSGSAIGASSFYWSPLTGLDDNTVFNPMASPLDTTVYYLTITDLNGCSNTDSVIVNVIEDYKLVIYNVITPDGNGQNDTWTIGNIETFQSADIWIYDRWGSEVFSVKGYQNDWNGVDGTDQLPDGTYYYVIRFDDSELKYSGAITVLRNK